MGCLKASGVLGCLLFLLKPRGGGGGGYNSGFTLIKLFLGPFLLRNFHARIPEVWMGPSSGIVGLWM